MKRAVAYMYTLFLINSLCAEHIFYLPDAVIAKKGFEGDCAKRISSAPYISGDTFQAFCDHVFDETSPALDVDAIQPGDTIFLIPDAVPYFFEEVFYHIEHPFVLVTHNGDTSLPGEFAPYLDEENIIAWFTVNLDCAHSKAFGLPIGIANRYWPHGDIEEVKAKSAVLCEKSTLLCATYAMPTHTSRRRIYDYFQDKPYCYFPEKKSYGEYLTDLQRSKFVLSPRGAGMDCHRTWEAMLMGSIPIVPMTLIDPIYADLPVLIIDGWSWEMLTEEFLERVWTEFSQKTFNYEKLYAAYWFDLIREQAERAKKGEI